MSTVPASLRRYRAELVAAIDRELGDAHPAQLHRMRPRPRHSRWGALLVATAIMAVALLVLTIASPWQSGTTILDRAEAALLAPSAGQVLYERVTVHPILFSSRGTVGRVELWLSSGTPHRFRMTFGGAWRAELGGALGSSTGLSYVASDHALRLASFQFSVRQSDLDPAAFIRTALRSGQAEVDGRATIRGHDVIRIRVSTWFDAPTTGPRLEPIALYYVDARSYRPVRIVIPPPRGVVILAGSNMDALVVHPENTTASFRLGIPMDPSAFLLGFPGYSAPTEPVIPGDTTVSRPRPHRTYDFEDYRLIAPTSANRRLTNVRAIHPRATAP